MSRRPLGSIDSNQAKRPTFTKQKDKQPWSLFERSSSTHHSSIMNRPLSRKKSSNKSKQDSKRRKSEFTVKADDLPASEQTSVDLPVVNAPIGVLHDDIIYLILSYCADIMTLNAVSGVCKRWRSIATDPWMWRSLDTNWDAFANHMERLTSYESIPSMDITNRRLDVNRTCWRRLGHIRSLYLNDPSNAIGGTLVRLGRQSSPFSQLRKLQLDGLYFVSILNLISWTSQLQELDCRDIRTTPPHSFCLSFFSTHKLKHLKKLRLQLQVPNCHIASLVGGGLLPESLTSLAIHNLYDPEEQSVLSGLEGNVSLQEWNSANTMLIDKYRPFRKLSRLTSLALCSCKSYTAQLIRQCFIPCSAHLRTLSLSEWDGGLEPPALLEEGGRRHGWEEDALYATDLSAENALADWLASMHEIRAIELTRFRCGQGLLQGLGRLERTYTVTMEGKEVKLADMQGIWLNDTRIAFSR
ncbi:hypothetical protein BCR43DRAFT_525506 [Syncephalastrum racemosum]|uniref:F-box domain-containing protein n=1 Tax=Syncephalastrum racemosum TaxID=13706 RepID=A0A1X2HB41_SYNRA|nr:hypothetical protein BCR43DRAFT_525506 [Syncephalastrum racemosum]